MFKNFISLPRKVKQSILIIIDVITYQLSIILTFLLQTNSLSIYDEFLLFPWLFIAPMFIIVPLFIKYGLYRSVLKYIGPDTFSAIFNAISMNMIFLGVLNYFVYNNSLSYAVLIVLYFILIVFTFINRFLAHWFLYQKINKSINKTNVAIYGAGEAGAMLSNSLKKINRYKLVAFFDDDIVKHGTTINSIEIFNPSRIESLIESKNIKTILLAIPSLGKKFRFQLLSKLTKYPVNVQELPSIEKIIGGVVTVDDIRQIKLEDILERDQIKPKQDLLKKNIYNKSILITGAGGSIGSEISRQVLTLNPSKIILFDNSEFNLYKINEELKNNRTEIIPILSSINNKKKLNEIFTHNKIDTIYHAAAYKHVPLLEQNVMSAVYNNIIGTYTLVTEVLKNDIETFVLISTDKAVRPRNIMGATKRFTELIIQNLNKTKSQTIFSIVRFGNVIDSAGSVVPLFREQIKNGGPITVTDPNVLRYFLSIPEAVQLVIQAGALGKGGEIFVLDMGEPVNILSLAKKMIFLSGLEPMENNKGDIEIKIIGLRPGEKMTEELFFDKNFLVTVHPRILMAKEIILDRKKINELVIKILDLYGKQDIIGIKNFFNKNLVGSSIK